MDERPVKPTAATCNRSLFSWRTWAAGAALAAAAALGCQGDAPPGGPPKDPDVLASTLVADRVTDFEVFTGRVQTMHYQDIKARVTGHLKEIHFKEGEDVNAGDPLFDIDATPYEAARDLAAANVNQSDALAVQAEAHFKSADDLYRRDLASAAGTAEQDQIQHMHAREEADAALKAARATFKATQATLKAAQINVDYCHIKADFSGRISRLSVDLNNDVIADNTVLASLVQLQPRMYAYFDVDERSLLDLLVSKKGVQQTGQAPFLPQGKVSGDAVKNLRLTLGLANEDPRHFSHPGDLVIADNKIDASTGTLRMWGTFPNEARDLEPNMFARVRVDVGLPRDALFVAEAALGSDQGFRYLYVVNEKNEAEYTRVDVGQKQNGLVAVTSASGYKELTKDTRVVVDGLQRIHPVLDDKAQPKPVKLNVKDMEMPRAKDATP